MAGQSSPLLKAGPWNTAPYYVNLFRFKIYLCSQKQILCDAMDLHLTLFEVIAKRCRGLLQECWY
jgi:hypothetical protein